MSSPRPATASPSWLPELTNRGVVYVLLALGLIGTVAEVASTVFIPRLILDLMVLAVGTFGLIRCRRAVRRAPAALQFASEAAVAIARR
jgi:hypothetical protein